MTSSYRLTVRPKKSFKPSPLRGSACVPALRLHAFAATARAGLTQVLALIGDFMANPRVFISSTCYDLASERDSLIDFCRNFGFDVALSERGDVFFHPDLHTHESCVNEIGNCHLLVLIVGGRFGGRYIVDPKKSITNAEYSAAREAGIPIFTFIKHDVLQDHNLWQSNKSQEFAAKIHYPSIDKQSHAVDIFKFIDDIRLSKNNNSYFPFTLPREIHEQLRKQWAAMFLEGLKNRGIAKQMLITNEALARISSVSQKIEDLTKSIYKNIDSTGAATAIQSLDLIADAREMFHLIGSKIEDTKFLLQVFMKELTSTPPPTWWQFLTGSGLFEIDDVISQSGITRRAVVYLELMSSAIPIEKPESKREELDLRAMSECYAAFLSLPMEDRRQIYEEFSYVPAPDPEDES